MSADAERAIRFLSSLVWVGAGGAYDLRDSWADWMVRFAHIESGADPFRVANSGSSLEGAGCYQWNTGAIERSQSGRDAELLVPYFGDDIAAFGRLLRTVAATLGTPAEPSLGHETILYPCLFYSVVGGLASTYPVHASVSLRDGSTEAVNVRTPLARAISVVYLWHGGPAYALSALSGRQRWADDNEQTGTKRAVAAATRFRVTRARSASANG